MLRDCPCNQIGEHFFAPTAWRASFGFAQDARRVVGVVSGANVYADTVSVYNYC